CSMGSQNCLWYGVVQVLHVNPLNTPGDLSEHARENFIDGAFGFQFSYGLVGHHRLLDLAQLRPFLTALLLLLQAFLQRLRDFAGALDGLGQSEPLAGNVQTAPEKAAESLDCPTRRSIRIDSETSANVGVLEPANPVIGVLEV